MAKNTRTPAATTARTAVAEAPVADDPNAVITSALATAPNGLTARQITTDTPLSAGVVTTTLQTLAEAGVVARTPGATNGTRKSADVWTLLAPPAATDDDTTTDTPTTGAPTTGDFTDEADASATSTAAPDEATTDPTTPDTTTADGATPDDTAPAGDDEATTDDVRTALPEAPVSGAPVSGAPAGKPDLRIIMVAGVLGDHPDGVSAVDIANESGLRAQIVARALAAMQVADAARVLAGDEASTVELWVRGDGDPAEVDLANVPTFTECPTCGHKTRIRTATGARRTGPGAPGINSDGSAKLAKGELRQLVLDFINTHPGHDLTAGIIARELGRSPGAVGNNLDTFINEGLVTQVDAPGKPVTVTALSPAPATATAA